MSEGGQQRAFANRIKLQSAQQIRQNTTATVKAATEKVSEEEHHQRTEVPCVPQEAISKKTGLLTEECLKLYSSNWNRVTYNYSKYGSSFSKLLDLDYHQQLSQENFELDLAEEERLAQISTCGSGTPLSRRGYLYKGTFPQDGGISVSMKNYRKRWFVLTGCPSEGGYVLIFYKDEKSSNIKGKIELDTCTEIKPNSRHKTYGFDLMTEDDKVFYPLAADSQAEMEEWTTILTRAIASEMEDVDGEGVNTLSSFYSKDTLKDVKKLDIRPDMLEHSATIEATNAKARSKEWKPLFNIYPEFMQASSTSREDLKVHAPVPEEKLGCRFMVKCNQLEFKLTTERNGERGNIEPFFVTLALYDASKCAKISEDFHVDLNSPYIKQMVPPLDGSTDDGPHPLSQKATRANEAVFSVTIPNPDIYLVAKVEKILQGGITACAEPYMKANPGEISKAGQKLAQQITAICGRLGQHRMPFAWAFRPIFNESDELDTTSEFSALIKQDSQKLTDEDLMKVLADSKNFHKHKLQFIPSSLNIEVLPFKHPTGRHLLTSSLLPVKAPPSAESGMENGDVGISSPSPSVPIIEVQEFPPLEAYDSTSHYYPYLTFRHHLYVYPTSLKYDNQKAFAKARNIACCVQFKDSDDRDAKALPVIYSKCCSATFSDRANTAVLHHCTTPTYYEEVKVKLPVELKPSHHLLFTFSHIACDVQKATKMKSSTKLPPVETIVGYAWLPLMDLHGRVSGGVHNLPVAASLPFGYLGLCPPSPQSSRSGASSPEVRWVDNQKPLFTVSLKLDSTVCTEDLKLHKFFKQCRALHSTSIQTPTMTELLSAVKSLDSLELPSIIRFLPLIFAQLFKLLSHSSKDVENIKPDVLRLLILLVDKVVESDGAEILRSYIEFMFVTEVDTSKKKAVHDEMARLLVQYLRQQGSSPQIQLLQHLWFFLEVILKSMAQYLFITKKINASRKSRYPEDFGWNLQSLITTLLSQILNNYNDASARKANRSIAEFVKHAFSFMDRGVVFKIVARYLDAFGAKETSQTSSVKLEFLQIICDHEHFVSLNLPFPISTENMDFALSDDFCRKHFLIGILLREVECSLEYNAGSVRRKTFEILRNLIAKHDCDPRYADPAQKGRIALLYFPLIPLVLNHVDRLNTGCSPYISPMLNATSMAYFSGSHGQSMDSPSQPGSAFGTLRSNSEKEKSMSLERGRQQKNSVSHAEESISLSELSEFSSLNPAPSPTPTLTEHALMEMERLSEQETRDLLISVLFVLKYLDRGVLQHWWRECMGSSNTSALLWTSLNDTLSSQFSQLLDFFDLLESCVYAFRYVGKRAVAIKMATSGLRQLDFSSINPQQSLRMAPAPPTGKEKVSKKHSTGSLILSSPASSLMLSKGKPSRSTITSVTSSLSGPLSSLRSPMTSITPDSAEVDLRTNVEAALSKEVGLIILHLMDIFGTCFRRELSQEDGDNVLMSKFFSLFISFLHVCQSESLQTHVFAMLRAFTFQFRDTLYKGSSDCCGILCYEALQCCNSRLPSTRTEATILLYLIMRGNFECFSGKRGFIRAHIQSTIAVSKLVTNLLGQSDGNLRKSLSTIATFVSQDDKVKGTSFPVELQDLMKRLKTVLSSTAQMQIHKIDEEKLVDLHYALAKSYSTSPELRRTWLDSMIALHLKYGNYSEAAHCCIHIAGLVAEYLRIKGMYPAGCTAFRHISPNIEREETSIKDDRESAMSDELTFTERSFIAVLESSMTYLEQAERYEMMAEVFKLLQPFYEKARDFEKMRDMYGKLHFAFGRVVDVMSTGRRYLGTFFRISFFGKPFGDDNEKQFIYKEPKVTKLGELTLRLQKLYSKKFGNRDIVHIIKESGRVNVSALPMEHAHIQITHVEPYFTSEELQKRPTPFERENKISRFVFETPFTTDGKPSSDVTKQCMRKTILTTSHWFPYVKKRILVLDQEQFELTAIEVAIEAMEKKTAHMNTVVKMDPPDLKGLQLVLQGSISTQVNQGVQEYTVFLREPHVTSQPEEHVERLKETYRSFMQVCQEALDLNGSLISTDQLLYQDELKSKFQQMQSTLVPLLDIQEEPQRPLSPNHPDGGYPRGRRGTNQADPHRMSAILFSSISGSK